MDRPVLALAPLLAVRTRRMTLDDAREIAALLRASDIATLGHSDYTLTELEGDLKREDLEHAGWYADDGSLVGYGYVGQVGDSEKVEIDVYVHPDHDAALGVEIVAALEARGRELVADDGHDSALFDTGAYRQDERTRGWLRDSGFQVETTFTRMRIDLTGPVDVRPLPAGVAVRRSDAGEDDLRTAHQVDEASFVEHYGHHPLTFEEYREKFEANGPGWASLWLGYVDDEPAGVLVGSRQFEEDNNAGYVRRLCVTPAARGRGLAKALLLAYFAAAQDEGRTAVLLHVDQGNVTPALGLYESVGMRAVLQIDAWAKRVTLSERRATRER
jgi:mycothiol synthase